MCFVCLNPGKSSRDGGWHDEGPGAGEDQKEAIPVTWVLKGETSRGGITGGGC